MKRLLLGTLMLGATLSLSAQKEATLTVQADKGTDIIPKESY